MLWMNSDSEVSTKCRGVCEFARHWTPRQRRYSINFPRCSSRDFRWHVKRVLFTFFMLLAPWPGEKENRMPCGSCWKLHAKWKAPVVQLHSSDDGFRGHRFCNSLKTAMFALSIRKRLRRSTKRQIPLSFLSVKPKKPAKPEKSHSVVWY